METPSTTSITVEVTIHEPVEKVWHCFTVPQHIEQWNAASDDWYTPHTENDLRTGGKFVSRMEAKDGSVGFDFSGVYSDIKTNEYIAYTLDDGRKVEITFTSQGNETKVTEVFEAENTNAIELQKGGWQAILNNFKKYTEAQ